MMNLKILLCVKERLNCQSYREEKRSENLIELEDYGIMHK